MRYETQPADPGILFEIYFPKKINYQSAIYETLKKGNDHEYVLDYLEKNEEHIRLLFPPKLRIRLNKRRSTWEQVYFGFSLYEVDGAFFVNENIIEDRTQVIRLLVHPSYDEILKNVDDEYKEDIMEHARQFRKLPMSLSSDSVEKYLKFYAKEIKNDERKMLIEVLEKMARWLEDSYVFVFGYVIGQLTSINEIDEKEIWVTSYRSAVINRIKFR